MGTTDARMDRMEEKMEKLIKQMWFFMGEMVFINVIIVTMLESCI